MNNNEEVVTIESETGEPDYKSQNQDFNQAQRRSIDSRNNQERAPSL